MFIVRPCSVVSMTKETPLGHEVLLIIVSRPATLLHKAAFVSHMAATTSVN